MWVYDVAKFDAKRQGVAAPSARMAQATYDLTLKDGGKKGTIAVKIFDLSGGEIRNNEKLKATAIEIGLSPLMR